MKIHELPGGVHPPEEKARSLGDPIGRLPLPERLVLPLAQHLGAPARPTVAKGERVLGGQRIAEAQGAISAHLHAPTSGRVVGVEERPIPHPSGLPAPCLVLEVDGRDEWRDPEPLADPWGASPERLLSQVRAAGIVGLGGAGFPTAVKLAPRRPIHTLILNGTECEPYITCDDALMRERAAQVIAGGRLMARILGGPKILVGIEDNKPAAFEAMAQAAAPYGIEVVEFPTKYPSGGERQLIQILTGLEVPSGGLPADLGIVVQNVGTAHAVYRAVVEGLPLTHRIVTVTGGACRINRNYELPVGMAVAEVLAHNQFAPEACTRLVMGGPMMGFALPDPTVPVVKTTNCLLALSAAEAPAQPPPERPCIRCGLCAEACPASLLPQQLFWYGLAKDWDRLRAHNLFDCIECGACAYVCPSQLPLVQVYRAAKGEIRELERERRKAERARRRFEAHKARLAREEAARAARRATRRQAADAGEGGDAPSVAQLIAAARSEARGADPAAERARRQRAVAAAEERLRLAAERLAAAEREGLGDSQRAALEARRAEAEAKLAAARRALAELEAEAAGARAMDKIAASPRERLQGALRRLEDKLAALEGRIAAAAPEERPELESARTKLREKIAEVRSELAGLGPEGDRRPEDPAALDAAARAIARARERAAARAALSPVERARADVASLAERVERARQKLERARAEGAEQAAALTEALERLEEKLARARAELAALEGDETRP
ncbi:MAG: hypothetical protein KatS3mg124_0197 [Porticoccaceae bacterium]|nr:MAG: hypothetical protein KatS3mg124_0197 [Porticoccaceae bacterium]